jgi:murein DD-endopeptidase MepM/ murein hydrolase activator NlpD
MRILSPLVLTVALLCAVVPGADAEEQPRGEWPLRPQPKVIERFDPPESPYGAGHRGVDLLGHVAQTVHASLAGTVTFAGMLAGRGVVVVSHGDTRTTYEPVTATVALGDAVPAGGPIGVLELPGSHCFPRACLHWGWLRGETYLDPLRLVRGGPVRLLPLSVLPSTVRPGPPPTHHRPVLGSSAQARGWAWR